MAQCSFEYERFRCEFEESHLGAHCIPVTDNLTGGYSDHYQKMTALGEAKRALYHAILVAHDDCSELDLKIGFLLMKDPYIQRLIASSFPKPPAPDPSPPASEQ